MGRTFSRPERMRMFFRQYLNEMEQLGVNSIGIVLLISFFIGAVITIQIKLNIESPWMPRWTVGLSLIHILHWLFVRIAENGMFITLYVAHVVTTEVSSLSKKKQLYN